EDVRATSAVTSPILAVGSRYLPAPGQVFGGAERDTKAHSSDLQQPAAGTQQPPPGGVSPDVSLPAALVFDAVTGAFRVDRVLTSRQSAPSQSLPPFDSVMPHWDSIASAAGVGQPPQEIGRVTRLRKRAALAASVPREVSTSSVPPILYSQNIRTRVPSASPQEFLCVPLGPPRSSVAAGAGLEPGAPRKTTLAQHVLRNCTRGLAPR